MRAIAAAISLCLFGLHLHGTAAFAQSAPAQSARSKAPLGQFEGDVVAKFMRDGRNMQLEKPFTYVDPTGKRWEVPAGAVTDGASIPSVLWTCCPPFTGKYRAAAVVHDYYCQTKSRPWRDVHKVFYHAMLAGGVTGKQAKVMFGAVYQFGPRWGADSRKLRPQVHVKEQQKSVKALEALVEKSNPSIEELMRQIDEMP